MQLSTNLPYGPKAIRAYLDSLDAGAPLMPMNVSKEADDAYRREKGLFRFKQKPRTDADFARQEAKWDKMAAKRARKTGVLPTGWLWCAYDLCKLPFRPHRASTVCCSPRCKYRWQQTQPQGDSVSAELPS
jgi:hypothetical protein